jgi:2-polyprenyl-3-methyl-5-hydroxy-6-metoxy-1,4-benzoquinol methylase
MSTYYGNIRHDVLRYLPDRSFRRALEVGGGEFGTLVNVKGKDLECWGVDVREPSQKVSRFVQGSFTDEAVAAQLPDGGFDLIMANDVLEHIEDTDRFFETVRRKLAADGVLALSVPNARQIRLAYQLFVRGTFPRTDAGLFDRTHLRWFCKRDVRAFLKVHGMEVVKSKSVGRLVPAVLETTVAAEFLGLQNLFIARHA